jgi:hypothetical protein
VIKENATPGHERQHGAPVDSHGTPAKPTAKRALPDAASNAQKGLDVRAAVPLHLRPVLNGYAEAEALGICPERTLRRHIATGRVKRAVIRNGRRLRFVTQVLIDELRQVED